MRRLLIALLALLGSSRAGAQTGAPAGSQTGDETSRLAPAYGVHYGLPMRFSIALGGTLDMDRRRTQGAIAMLEQGQHGNELSAGYFRMIGRYGSGFSVRGAMLRTSGEPWEANPNTTYVGGEVHLQLILGVGGRAGLLRRASRESTGSHDSIVTLGLSIGA
jgi:hypothetical protein